MREALNGHNSNMNSSKLNNSGIDQFPFSNSITRINETNTNSIILDSQSVISTNTYKTLDSLYTAENINSKYNNRNSRFIKRSNQLQCTPPPSLPKCSKTDIRTALMHLRKVLHKDEIKENMNDNDIVESIQSNNTNNNNNLEEVDNSNINISLQTNYCSNTNNETTLALVVNENNQYNVINNDFDNIFLSPNKFEEEEDNDDTIVLSNSEMLHIELLASASDLNKNVNENSNLE